MAKIDNIEKEVKQIKKILIEERPPEKFGRKDFVYSFFGALVVGLTFMFKGLLIQSGLNLSWTNVILIVLITIIILTVEIYFIGYARVKDKKKRRFGQFWLKRLFTIYLIAMFVSFLLGYLYGIHSLAGTETAFLKIIFAVSMPCAIGAAFTDLLKKY